MRTVISHFYNEEYLLPWWLEHHLPIFDHGILIDYGSTDSSVDICRQLAPHWSIVRSRNVDFAALEVDFEVMQYERDLPGWKMALNTTEFLMAANLPAIEGEIVDANCIGAWCPSFVMVDPSPDTAPTPDLPLVRQKPFGLSWREKDLDPICHPLNMQNPARRDRLYHRASFGAYMPGRHQSHMPGQCFLNAGAYVLWYGFSPWTPAFRQRKGQVRTRFRSRIAPTGLASTISLKMMSSTVCGANSFPWRRMSRPNCGDTPRPGPRKCA